MSASTVPFVLRNSGALTQLVCPSPCLATVVFTSMGAGNGYTHRCDGAPSHLWLKTSTGWERK